MSPNTGVGCRVRPPVYHQRSSVLFPAFILPLHSPISSSLILRSSADRFSMASSSSSSTGSLDDARSQTYLNQEQWYHYQPNEGFAVFATVAFAFLTVSLGLQTLRYRKQRFMVILAAGALAEGLGYLLRYLVTQGAGNTVFILSYVLILITPNAFALVNYHTVGRLLLCLPTKPRPETWLRIPIISDSRGLFIPGRIATFFFTSDVIAFIIQCVSAAFLTSSNPSTISTGQTIIEIGLAWALAFIALFFFVTIFITVSTTYEVRSHPQYTVIKKMYISLSATITLLLVRNIYRMIEYVEGNTGYVSTHEGFFGVFDTAFMLLCCLFYFLFPYTKYLDEIHYPDITDKVGQRQKQLPVEEVELENVLPSPEDDV